MISSIKNINLFKDDLTSLKIDPSKTIFVSGAGISCDSPSGLPLGIKLTDLFLDHMIGKEMADVFRKYWLEHFPRIAYSVHEDDTWSAPAKVDDPGNRARPRLEFIIGEMNKMDLCLNGADFEKADNRKHFTRKSSLEVIRNFQLPEPNPCHHKLARFMKAGSEMVTANFDVCLEKAAGMDINATEESDETHWMKAVRHSGMTVYHYHGASTDPQLQNRIGATLKEISRKLPTAFTEWMEHCFESGYDIVFVGYGAVDIFDVKPFFDSLEGKEYPGRAYYVNHFENEEKAINAIEDTSKPYRYLLNPFPNAYICYGKTNDFLDALLQNAGLDIPEIKADPDQEITSSPIETALEALTEDMGDEAKQDYYLINLFRLCAQLTINPTHLFGTEKWIKRIRDIVLRWEADGPKTLSNIANANGFSANSIIGDIARNDWKNKKYDNSGLREIVRPHLPPLNVRGETELTPYLNWKKGPAPRRLIEEKVALTDQILENRWEDPASLLEQQMTVYYLCGDQTKLLYLLWEIWPLRPLVNRKLCFLLEMVNKLLKHPETAFTYRTSYITLCRVKNMIQAMTRKRNDENINPVTGCYGELYREWNVCLEVPTLLDADKVLKNRERQLDIRKRRHLPVDTGLEQELTVIRKEFEKWFGE